MSFFLDVESKALFLYEKYIHGNEQKEIITRSYSSLYIVRIKDYTTITNFSMKYHSMCKVYTDVGGIK